MITFHWYGFILGLALILGWHLVELKSRRENLSPDLLQHTFIWALVLGLVGARIWHLFTDWTIYQDNVWAIVAVWNGGLSIFGAIVGGSVGVWLANRKNPELIPVILDLSVFGLPFAQALGRLGNFINQELYGYPSSLPWAIYIDPANRISEYMNSNRFHPLFVYEMMATFLAGLTVWFITEKKALKLPFPFQVGEGGLFLVYLEYYAGIRILLDFLRPQKAMLIENLGLNQAILMVFMVINAFYLWQRYEKKRTLAEK